MGDTHARRATIRDVARRAGVSTAAVSLTFSGKPGVSPATRRRIEAAAAALGWQPSPLARILAGSATAHGGTVALSVPVRPRRTWSSASDEFMAGALAELSRAGRSGLMAPAHGQSAHSDLTTLRQWWQAGRIGGAILLGAGSRPEAADALASLGVAVVAVAPAHPDPGTAPTVWWDDRAASRSMIAYLSALGHRRIGYIADQAVQGRVQALRESAAGRRVEHLEAVGADRDAEAAQATRSMLWDPRPPTVVIYDSAVGATAGLGVAREMGIDVPRALSILAWQDSVLCTLTRPRITAMASGMTDLGGRAVRALLALLDHRTPPPETATELRPAYRDSVAPRE